MSILIGLTGGIGSGKSLAASYFEEQGARIIDADLIGRQLVEPDQPAWKEIVEAFGTEFLNPDQTLNREKVARVVFQNTEKKYILEKIIHPRVLTEEQNQYQDFYKSDPNAVVIIHAALLIESGNYKNVDKVIIVKSSDEVQIRRVMARNGRSHKEVANRLKTQMVLEEKLEFADYILNNDGAPEELKSQVCSLYPILKNLI